MKKFAIIGAIILGIGVLGALILSMATYSIHPNIWWAWIQYWIEM